MSNTIYNKVTIDGATYIDLSQDTVSDASHIRQGYTGHLNDGTTVTGTYAGSGVDVPVFDLLFDSNGDFASATCNETFSECFSRLDSGDCRASIHKYDLDGWSMDETANCADGQSNDYLEYVVGGAWGPVYDIVYHANGTIDYIEPSTHQDTLIATSNGEYGSEVGVYTSVTVNVPSGSPNLQAKTNINPTTASQTIQPDSGYDGLSSVQINAMPSGTATTPATTITANPSISVSASGLITASVSGSENVTPSVSAGYVSAGTAGTVSVSGSNTQQLTTKAAATITPGTTAQTIAAGTYLTGVQTIAGDSNLVSGNILSGKSIFGVQGGVTFQTYYTGSSAPASSLGVNGDIYLQT